MSENTNAILADIRKRNEERKVAEAEGVIGGARTAFDVDFLLRYIDSIDPPIEACTCTNICPEDRTENDCPYCSKALDIYDPCPVVGFGCGTCGDIDDPCCTPEQQKAAKS